MTDTAVSAAHAPGALPVHPWPRSPGPSSGPDGRSWPRPGCWPTRSGSRTTGWRSCPRARCSRPGASPGAGCGRSHTFGPTHFPRPEEWPVMPAARCGFMLKPAGFFGRNPTLDVPHPARTAPAPAPGITDSGSR
ncbi:MAG TPA: hypothetical protein VFX25_15285 [Streptosporangiaceae bacterium]|nr:hypothetical protein [Streptosporangiaceae bacterium]